MTCMRHQYFRRDSAYASSQIYLVFLGSTILPPPPPPPQRMGCSLGKRFSMPRGNYGMGPEHFSKATKKSKAKNKLSNLVGLFALVLVGVIFFVR